MGGTFRVGVEGIQFTLVDSSERIHVSRSTSGTFFPTLDIYLPDSFRRDVLLLQTGYNVPLDANSHATLTHMSSSPSRPPSNYEPGAC